MRFISRTIFVSCILPLVLWVILPPTALAQRGALTAHANITQLTRQSAAIVRGFVVSARVEPHPQLGNLTTVLVTIRVESVLKGDASMSSITFRQFIWDIRDKSDGAGYQKGQHLLILLNRTSPYGLTSPAGLEQGRFRIVQDKSGKFTASNGYGNVGLFTDVNLGSLKLSPASLTLIAHHRQGPVGLTQLEEIIRQAAGGGR